jgi:hypothetical protein
MVGIGFLLSDYLVDAEFPNKAGYLAPYHVLEWRREPGPSGEPELFNHLH